MLGDVCNAKVLLGHPFSKNLEMFIQEWPHAHPIELYCPSV